MVGIPVRLKKTPGSLRTPAPELGEHTEEVLGAIGGFDDQALQDLRDRGVIN